MNMSVNQKILDAFEAAHKKRSAVKHPLCGADFRLRSVFVHATALVACVDNELSEREELERLARLLEVPEEIVEQAINAAESAEIDLVEST
jgi:prephenate dehydrogenase